MITGQMPPDSPSWPRWSTNLEKKEKIRGLPARVGSSAGVPKRASAPPHVTAEGLTAMSRILTTMKHRRIEARNAREWQRLLASVGSPAMRDELIVISQRSMNLLAR
jgi:hypothetical protein